MHSATRDISSRLRAQRMEYAEVEAEFMWGLLDPSILSGEVRASRDASAALMHTVCASRAATI